MMVFRLKMIIAVITENVYLIAVIVYIIGYYLLWTQYWFTSEKIGSPPESKFIAGNFHAI